jgi:hypothetical protein
MVIDPGLARGIRHGYMRQVRDAWKRFGLRWKVAKQRSRHPAVDTPKSYRKACAQGRDWLGPLLNVTEMQLSSGAKAAWLSFSLQPHFDPTALGAGDLMRGQVLGFLRPGGGFLWDFPIAITGHTLDRVIQLAGLVTTPLAVADIHAINAEFADLLHFAGPAVAALARLPGTEAAELNVLLPSQHGFFLCDFVPSGQSLVVRTFVDEAKLWPAEREALRELREVNESELAVLALGAVAPRWMACADSWILSRLPEIWRHLGWRLKEEERPGGLSDRAWQSRDLEMSVGKSCSH